MGNRVETNYSVYDVIADTYDEEVLSRPFQQNWDAKIHSVLGKYVPVVDPSVGVNAIDIGAGTGIYSEVMLNKGYRVIAVDSSSGMIRSAREKLSSYDGRFIPEITDVLKVGGYGKVFQIAISFGGVLNHIEAEWDTFFKKIHSLVDEGGLFIFDVENTFGIDYFFYVIYSHIYRKSDKPSLNEILGSIRCQFGSKPYTYTLPWEFDSQVVNLRLTYHRLGVIKRLLRENGFEILNLDGINILSCLLPEIALTATHKSSQTKTVPGMVARLLNRMDSKLGRWLYGIAGVHFVVSRKI